MSWYKKAEAVHPQRAMLRKTYKMRRETGETFFVRSAGGTTIIRNQVEKNILGNFVRMKKEEFNYAEGNQIIFHDLFKAEVQQKNRRPIVERRRAKK